MTTAIEAFAPAKINLTLHVTGVRSDGYHVLESLVVFADCGDRLLVSPSESLSLTVDGPFAQGVPTDNSNLVMQAAERLRNLRGITQGATINLTKTLPHGAGIGGGSSDAAAAIRGLAELWGVAPLSGQEALPLGADVPVCLCAPTATQMRGIGDVLATAPYQLKGWLVLVNPGVVVPTGKVFARHDALYDFTPANLEPMDWIKDDDDLDMWLLGQRNDLTKVASDSSIAPVVQDVLKELRVGSRNADMSGSGSTCWGLFTSEDKAKSCADRIAAKRPEWWVRAARILP
ncbi:4-(cytidine 5'-diphospho)-2-C-methyl-D-erythritol kinase [Marivita hallyeonensis]|nr:4-(cytidine 5'-diphospho)-2-C-methyl-D-erythritol kinase [Marivita hallyeonensis]